MLPGRGVERGVRRYVDSRSRLPSAMKNFHSMRFSTHDPSRLTGDKAKFVNEPALWKQTEDMVRDTLKKSGIPYVEVPNEAAFYGPKIDVQVWSVIGREFSIATNQVDFAVPARFGLT